jgi:hypothetical protein
MWCEPLRPANFAPFARTAKPSRRLKLAILFAVQCRCVKHSGSTNRAGSRSHALESIISCYRCEPLAPRLAQCWQLAC